MSESDTHPESMPVPEPVPEPAPAPESEAEPEPEPEPEAEAESKSKSKSKSKSNPELPNYRKRFLAALGPELAAALEAGPCVAAVDAVPAPSLPEFARELPASVQEALAGVSATPPIEFPAEISPTYFIFETADGEVPVIRSSRTLLPLLKHMHKLAKSDADIYAHVGLGYLMPFTRGERRLLVAPDGQVCEFYPRVCILDQQEAGTVLGLAPAMQDDGFLGPPELQLPPVIEAPKPRKKPASDEQDDAEGSGDPVPEFD